MHKFAVSTRWSMLRLKHEMLWELRGKKINIHPEVHSFSLHSNSCPLSFTQTTESLAKTDCTVSKICMWQSYEFSYKDTPNSRERQQILIPSAYLLLSSKMACLYFFFSIKEMTAFLKCLLHLGRIMYLVVLPHGKKSIVLLYGERKARSLQLCEEENLGHLNYQYQCNCCNEGQNAVSRIHLTCEFKWNSFSYHEQC